MLSQLNTTVTEEFDRKASDYLNSHSHNNTTMGMHEMLRRSLVTSLVNGGGKLLEIGCGPGWYVERFSNSHMCFGIDISINMLKECRKKNLNICLATGDLLPFKKETFDTIICINMFQYIDNPVRFLNQIRTSAKNNCIVVLDFKNKLSLRNVIHTMFSKYRDYREPDKEKRYSIFEVNRFLSESNWKIVKIVGNEFDCLPTSLKSHSPCLIGFFKRIDKFLSPSPLKFFSGRIFLTLKSKKS